MKLAALVSTIARAAFAGIAGALAELPQNDKLWAYTIHNGTTPYMTRVLFPRMFGRRLVLHRLWRNDHDRDHHNHPWDRATSLVLLGGYVEDRVVRGADGRNAGTSTRFYRPGQLNRLTARDFHRITRVLPGTWTLFLMGERVQDWGFRVDDEWGDPVFIPKDEYFTTRSLTYVGANS